MNIANNVNLIGRFTADPVLKQTPQGTAVCSFTVAVDRPTGKGKEKAADFIRCTAWRSAAELIAKYMTKGQMAALNGALSVRTWEDPKHPNADGTPMRRESVEVMVENVKFLSNKADSHAPAAQAAPATQAAPAQDAYATGTSAEDFAVIEANEDLPF